MIITPENFKNGGVVDFSASFHHRGRYGRVTVRESFPPSPHLPSRVYEVLIGWHRDHSEEVVHAGSLKRCVRIANLLTDTDDEVQDGT